MVKNNTLASIARKVIIIEDDVSLAFVLSHKLQAAGFTTKVVNDGRDGLHELIEHAYDIGLIDIGLPSLSGLSVVAGARENGIKIPLIVITTQTGKDQELQSFGRLANIFHPKPIDFDLLLEQVNALVALHQGDELLTVNGLTLDLAKRLLSKNGQEFKLTYKEFELLKLLMKTPGKAYTRAEIMRHTWKGTREIEQGSVDTLVSRLRQKIGQHQGHEIIATVHGTGFCINHELVPDQSG